MEAASEAACGARGARGGGGGIEFDGAPAAASWASGPAAAAPAAPAAPAVRSGVVASAAATGAEPFFVARCSRAAHDAIGAGRAPAASPTSSDAHAVVVCSGKGWG